MKACIETYGCSMNLADSQSIAGFLRHNGVELSPLEEAEVVIFNGCSVKERTENRMITRLRKLSRLSPKNGFRLVVFGCLAKTIPEKIREVSDSIILCNDFKELGLEFGFSAENDSFHFDFEAFSESPSTAIIPINSGCLNSCTFCSVKQARGNLHSFPIESIAQRFCRAIKNSKEIWLTSQDTGAYGFDINSSLPELLEELLSNKGDFRIRIGMANPWHFRRIESGLIPLFRDERLYRFLHIPLQSGSNRILSLMARGYTSEYWLGLVERLRSSIPNLTVSTDIIVGFPTETEEEFKQTLDALRIARPDIVNVSRYGLRPGTIAAKMQGQLHGRVKSERSRIASSLARRIGLENNLDLVGRTEKILVSEAGKKGGMAGRTNSYKQAVVPSGSIGEFMEAKINRASLACLFGTPIEGPLGEKIPAENAIVKAFNEV